MESSYIRNTYAHTYIHAAGGIHRYLEAFKEDGGFFVGKNYTFDKRFSHGAESNVRTISSCVHCGGAWDRYQAQKTCANKGQVNIMNWYILILLRVCKYI